MHDVITVGIPLLAILAGILFNRQDGKEIRAELQGLRSEMRSGIRALRSEMNTRFDGVQWDMR